MTAHEDNFPSKLNNSLADLERHERKIGRKVKLNDKDRWYWSWKLTSVDVLDWKFYMSRKVIR